MMVETRSSGGRLKGRIALITGGTSGIGKATAFLFGQEGAVVVITGRRGREGRSVAGEIGVRGGRALYLPADHTRSADCVRVVETVKKEFGRLDILFNNAGVVVSGTAEETPEPDWDLTMALNVTAVWHMSRLVVPVMRANGGGVIVNNASDWGLVAGPAAVAYCASKGAVVQMTRAMALDHARENIRINAVCPGDTYVERWSAAGYYQDSTPLTLAEIQADAGQSLPMGRVASAAEIARSVLFLASDESSYMTGAMLVVDGGNTAR